MREVMVATDSGANLPRPLAQQWGIEVIPLWIQMDDQSYRDGVDIQPLEFFQRLKERVRRLQTSQPSLGEFLEFYRRLQEKARSIVSIHVTSRYSGVFQAARAAAAELAPYPIEVVDSGTIAMAQGFIALAAARAAAAGASLAEVVERTRAAIPKVDLVAALETLEYAVRGGRLAWAARMVGNLLHVKPLVRVRDNDVSLFGQARSRTRAIRQLLDTLAQRVGDAAVHIAILHTGAVEEAQRLKEEILARFRCVEVYIEPVTPVLGVHAGPGALGLACYVEP
ncbi:MAG: DegV family protein [Anaerolineae bacterium]|nr:DegV family protein [Anaerolineae bacterium]MDW8068607.1 DegV family protein [Anaerolineae bacterium]